MGAALSEPDASTHASRRPSPWAPVHKGRRVACTTSHTSLLARSRSRVRSREPLYTKAVHMTSCKS
eukprot:354691-Chlamydomonas_euryale.AAC.4